MPSSSQPTHHTALGYVAWILGFMGLHRFYFGKPLTGILWLFTAGLLLVGWIVDLFLIPGMRDEACRRHQSGPVDHSIAWLFLVFLGVFGIHRFYMGKIGTGILWLLTAGLLGIGLIYDFCTLNTQVDEKNRA